MMLIESWQQDGSSSRAGQLECDDMAGCGDKVTGHYGRYPLVTFKGRLVTGSSPNGGAHIPYESR